MVLVIVVEVAVVVVVAIAVVIARIVYMCARSGVCVSREVVRELK